VGQGWFIFIILCGKEGCIGSALNEIGFVLQKKRAICRGVSTSVEGRQAGQDGRVGQKAEGRRQETESRRQETEDRRGNPDLVGMGVLVVASFSISRILYLLDVYYTSYEVRCQVNFNHRFRRLTQIWADDRRG